MGTLSLLNSNSELKLPSLPALQHLLGYEMLPPCHHRRHQFLSCTFFVMGKNSAARSCNEMKSNSLQFCYKNLKTIILWLHRNFVVNEI